jgi:hypothetical protein
MLRAGFTDREVIEPHAIAIPLVARLSCELLPGIVDSQDGASPVEHGDVRRETVEGRT